MANIKVDNAFQGTLKSILEAKAHEYRDAIKENQAKPKTDLSKASDDTMVAWHQNMEQCLKIAFQLRRT